MKMKVLLLTFFSYALILAQDLTISLSTAQKTKTVYLANARSLKNDYEKNLWQIFEKAIKFNRGFYFCPSTNTSEFWAHHKNTSMACDSERWHLRGVEYLMTPSFCKNKIELMLFDVASNHTQQIQSDPLTNDLTKDRQALLKLASKISQIILKKPSFVANKILFCNKGALYTMDYEGKQVQKLHTGCHDCTTPTSINNAGQFVFVSFDEGQSKLMQACPGQKAKPIVKLRGNQLLAAVSNKTNCIAYICDAASRADLYIQPFSPSHGAFKKPIQLFAKNGSVQASPTFHPNGTKLAFVSDQSGSTDIYLIDLLKNKGKKSLPKLQHIITKTKNNTSPCFSACGRILAYLSKVNGIRQVWIYNFESKESKQITFDAQNKESPCFSPCSQYILYNTSSNEHNIFLIGLESKQAIQLTNKGDCQYAVFLD